MYHRFYLLFCSLFSTFAFVKYMIFFYAKCDRTIEQSLYREGISYQSPLYLSPVKFRKVLIQFSLIITVEYAHFSKI